VGHATGWFTPVETLAVDEIDLADINFWQLPNGVKEGAFRTLRRERPVARFDVPEYMPDDGSGVDWFYTLVRYEDVVRASRDPKRFSSARGSVSIVDLPPEFLEFFGSMINTDDPRHAHLRRIVLRAFTPRRVERLEAEIRSVAHRLVAEAREQGEFDFVASVAAPLPLRIINEIMGIPPSHDEFVLTSSQRILGAFDPEFVPPDVDPETSMLNAGIELVEFLGELASTRDPTEDTVLNALLEAGADGEALTPSELTSFFILLLVAGNETTRNALSTGMIALSEFRDARRELIEHPSPELLAAAADEVVRMASPVVWMRRTMTAPVRVGGVELCEGDRVLLIYPSANRDEEVFVDPYRFRLDRDGNRHAGFGGFGPHLCLGAHLARAEIQAVLEEVTRQLPDYELIAEPDVLISSFIAGIKRLWISA
jgi:cytochrome P450